MFKNYMIKKIHFRDNIKSIQWDGSDDFGNDVSSGVYVYKVRTEGYSQSKKMLLIR